MIVLIFCKLIPKMFAFGRKNDTPCVVTMDGSSISDGQDLKTEGPDLVYFVDVFVWSFG